MIISRVYLGVGVIILLEKKKHSNYVKALDLFRLNYFVLITMDPLQKER